jgi:hypothetical protein
MALVLGSMQVLLDMQAVQGAQIQPSMQIQLLGPLPQDMLTNQKLCGV